MKITNFDLVQVYNILENCGAKKFPQKINFAITKNLKQLKVEIDIYQEALQNLFKSYDEFMIKKEDGTPEVTESGIPKVEKSHIEEFNKDLIDLLNTEIEINPYQIDEESFNYEDERYDVLPAVDMMNLQKILCNLEEKKED